MSNGGRELQQYNYCHCNRQGKRRKKQRRTNTLGGARGWNRFGKSVYTRPRIFHCDTSWDNVILCLDYLKQVAHLSIFQAPHWGLVVWWRSYTTQEKNPSLYPPLQPSQTMNPHSFEIQHYSSNEAKVRKTSSVWMLPGNGICVFQIVMKVIRMFICQDSKASEV